MSISINTNTTSLQALLNVNKSQSAYESFLEQISSGKRINHASDDASGLTIADALRSQERSLGQALKNSVDAVSISQTAEGAMGEATDILQTMRTQALQAANGSQTTESRAAIQADIDKSLQALSDLAQNTTYNDTPLLSGEFTNQSFQVGAESGQTISFSIESMDPSELGSGSGEGSLSDLNVLTAEDAQTAIGIIDAALDEIAGQQSELGSVQNQAISGMETLSAQRISAAASASSIEDVDMAEAVMNLNRMSTMNQAGMYALKKAGDLQKQVLSILGGPESG